jgi:imidazolonepropionase
MGEERPAPGRALADAGAICVLATDANPGTSPVVALPIVIALAVRAYGWTAREAFLAATLNAAHVLGRADSIGSVEVGKRADLVILDGPLEHVPYRLGHHPVLATVVGGELAWVREDARERVRA